MEQVKAIAADSGLIAETLAQAQRQVEETLDALDAEQRGVQKDLARANAEVRGLLGEIAGDTNGGPATARLADLQERVRLAEQRLTEIREEDYRLQNQLIDEDEVAEALRDFDPLWEQLSPREQARVIELLIERVDYDGTDSTVSVTFRPTGIKALAGEFAIEETAA